MAFLFPCDPSPLSHADRLRYCVLYDVIRIPNKPASTTPSKNLSTSLFVIAWVYYIILYSTNLTGRSNIAHL